jgi:orotidine-5'-phosphate decarboxylase
MSTSGNEQVRHKLIVALDVPGADPASRLAKQLRGHVGMFKVGSELFSAEGPAAVRKLVAAGDKVFLDLKFHDIPNTVRAAAREAAQLGVSMLNVHASGGSKMMRAAVEGAREGSERAGTSRPLVLAVTALTSLASEDLQEIGLNGEPEEVVVRLARLAQAAGLDGVVASAREIAPIRKACGPRFVIVTPGIRPELARDSAPAPNSAGVESSRNALDDQARIATPLAAIQAGADFLVVGRPITQAPDPPAAADLIASEMERALISTMA